MTESAPERLVRAEIMVSGRVQGVGYRAFAARVAAHNGLVGGVRNCEDGRVEVEVEGPKTVIDAVLRELRIGPPGARVTQIETKWSPATERFSSFSIWY